jgi:hypothetical protein
VQQQILGFCTFGGQIGRLCSWGLVIFLLAIHGHTQGIEVRKGFFSHTGQFECYGHLITAVMIQNLGGEERWVKSKGHIPVERSLSSSERTLLQWLLMHGSSVASKYTSQIDSLRIVSKCGCGCPTVDFALQSGRKVGGSDIVAEAGGKSPEGISVGIPARSGR